MTLPGLVAIWMGATPVTYGRPESATTGILTAVACSSTWMPRLAICRGLLSSYVLYLFDQLHIVGVQGIAGGLDPQPRHRQIIAGDNQRLDQRVLLNSLFRISQSVFPTAAIDGVGLNQTGNCRADVNIKAGGRASSLLTVFLG